MVSGHQACIVVSTLVGNVYRCREEEGATRPHRNFIEWDTPLEIIQVMRVAHYLSYVWNDDAWSIVLPTKGSELRIPLALRVCTTCATMIFVTRLRTNINELGI